jgi:hypothetical protein
MTMKNLFITMALLLALIGTANAEPASAADANGKTAAPKSITIEVGDSNKAELKQAIRDSVADIVEKALAADPNVDAEQRKQILDKISNMPLSAHVGGAESAGELAVGALAVVLIFGMPVMIVVAVLYWAYRRRRLAHETINQFLASGKDIPPAVLDNLFREQAPRNNLHKGLVMTGLGVGIFLCFALIGSMKAASVGLIPLFIGLAQLLIWKLERPGEAGQE